MRLSEFLARWPHLRPIYEVLEPFLPTTDIRVYPLGEAARMGYPVGATTLACAVPPDKLFFRHFPPDELTFAHELIHLCRKPPELESIDEEVWGYNLASIVAWMAKEGLMGRNPFKLFQLSEEQVNSVLRELGLSSIEDYYRHVGVIPWSHEEVLGPSWPPKLVRKYGWAECLIAFISELGAGLPYFALNKAILARLLERYC